ncbi:MAG TPA: FtsX-like permease family protein, partial [Longimicrobiales bacterium]|nr:FtsX-like permease family protein [Longimicrobiales bacterium]
LQGRGFEPGDDDDQAPPVAVVSRSMAQAYWPAGDALGACMLLGNEEETPPCTLVVGIVEDHRRQKLVEDNPEWLYFLNQSQPAFQGPPQGIMLGTDADATRLLSTVQGELRAASSQIRFVSAQSLQGNIDPQLRSWTLGASMFSVFGALALIVAAWGLYSVLAFEVANRRRELGIRAALGAGMPRLLRMVLTRAIVVVALGVGIGLTVAGLAARAVGPLLFTVSPWDPWVYVSVAVTLLAVAALAARAVGPLLFTVSPWDPWVYLSVAVTLLSVAVGAGLLPAWSATRVDPKEALQAE